MKAAVAIAVVIATKLHDGVEWFSPNEDESCMPGVFGSMLHGMGTMLRCMLSLKWANTDLVTSYDVVRLLALLHCSKHIISFFLQACMQQQIQCHFVAPASSSNTSTRMNGARLTVS